MAATAVQPPSVDELEKKEEESFRTGPLSVLTTSVKTNSQVRRAGSLAQGLGPPQGMRAHLSAEQG